MKISSYYGLKLVVNLLSVAILSTALAQGLARLGYEMGPAASVREQYKIFLIQRAEREQIIRKAQEGIEAKERTI